MPGNTYDVIELLKKLAEMENLQVSNNKSIKAGFTVAGMAAIFGLLFGPIGLVIGGTLGGCIAAATCRNFKLVVEVLSSMTPKEKNQLASKIRTLMLDVNSPNIFVFIAMVYCNASLKQNVLKILVNYLRNELSMAISKRVTMPGNTYAVIELLKKLAERENLQVSINENIKTGIIAVGMTAIFGLLMGPIGLVIGGMLGGCIAAATCRNFRPVVEVLSSMTPKEKKQLAHKIRTLMLDVNSPDIFVFIEMVYSNASLKQKVLKILVNYLRRELSMTISKR